jgi:hypothetical protein
MAVHRRAVGDLARRPAVDDPATADRWPTADRPAPDPTACQVAAAPGDRT